MTLVKRGTGVALVALVAIFLALPGLVSSAPLGGGIYEYFYNETNETDDEPDGGFWILGGGVSAVRSYDFTDSVNNTAQWCRCEGTTPPLIPGSACYLGATNVCGEGADGGTYSGGAYANVAYLDGNRNVWSWFPTSPPSSYRNLVYTIKVNEPVVDITQLDFTWVGYDELNSGGSFSLWVWNFTSASWVLLTNDATPRGVDQTYLVTYTSGFTDIVDPVTSNVIVGVAGDLVLAVTCLAGDTNISTPDGLKKLIDLKVGDEVYTFNGSDVETSTILQHVTRQSDKTYHIYFDSGVINARFDHPFFVKGVGYVATEDLQAGDEVFSIDSTYTTIQKINTTVEDITMYDLVVSENQNFFAEGLLVRSLPLDFVDELPDHQSIHENYFQFNVTFDSTPPTVEWNWTDLNMTIGRNWTWMCVNASEPVNCTLHFNGSDIANPANGTLLCGNLTGLADGNYTHVNATCEDQYGNLVDTTNVWVKVDTTPPTLTWNWSDINQTINVDYTYVCVSLDDTGNCTLHFNGTDYVNSTSGANICWNPSGVVADYWARQEDADDSYTEPGMGAYTNPENIEDNDWGTYGTWTGGNQGLHFVYQKPLTAASAIWQKKDDNDNQNYTIPTECWEYNSTHLHLRVRTFYQDVPPPAACTFWECPNGVGSYYIVDGHCLFMGYDNPYEENIFWNMTGLPWGNYTDVNATCEDELGNSANTSNAWLYVAECGNLIVEDGEDCDGGDCCTEECTFSPFGTLCRATAGVCDVEETCTGALADCPADQVEPITTVCRAVADQCDTSENCDGVNKDCPVDSFLPATVVCRLAVGDCDVRENCTGASANCPADLVEPVTTECRASAGGCDPAENCDGVNKDCPADSFWPATFVCRPADDVCDAAENCTGASADCPADLVEPVTTVCRVPSWFCDPAENCDGVNKACPADVPLYAICPIDSCDDDPSVADLYYSVTQNITGVVGTCFDISANNVVLDGNGSVLSGDGLDDSDYGIYAEDVEGITIKNFANISGFGLSSGAGIFLLSVNDSVILNSTMDSNGFSGVWLRDGCYNNTIEDCRMSSNSIAGISLGAPNWGAANNIQIINNDLIGNGIASLYIGQSSSNNLVSGNTITGSGEGIEISGGLGELGQNNTLLNNDISGNTGDEIADLTGASYTNYLVYNNSYGEIRWTDPSFLQDLTTEGDLTFPGSVEIGSNSAYFNPAGFIGLINSSADVTLDLTGLGIINPRVMEDGVECTDCEILSYAGEVVVFNVTSWSTYTVEEDPCTDNMFGSGTLIDPCVVTNWTQLDAVRENLTLYYALGNDLSSITPGYLGIGNDWTPIGDCGPDNHCYEPDDNNPFTGNFDGRGFTISDLNVNKPSLESVGLFGFAVLGSNSITNLSLVVDNVGGQWYVGGLVGQLQSGTVSACNVNVLGTVSGNILGGLIGANYGHIEGGSYAIVSGTVLASWYAGGLIGYNEPGVSIIQEGSYAIIQPGGTVSGAQLAGGLAALNWGTIRGGSYAIVGGTVSGTGGTSYVGGLVGDNYGTVQDGSYAIIQPGGNVSSTTYAGGLAGFNYYGIIQNSYAIIDSDATLSGTSGVGLAGNSSGTISNSYLIVNKTGLGNITFLDPNIRDSGVMVPGNIIVGNNTAYVNSAAKPGFNVSADISLDLTGWSFTNPAILRDGAVCDETTTPSCYNFTPLTDTIVKFNVSSWSNYTIGEVPVCPRGMPGNNTSISPCIAMTCEQLQYMNESLSGYFALGNDINCINTSIPGASIWDASGFNPIGCGDLNCGSRPVNDSFTGSFDGNGYTISNLYINRPFEDYVGLFGLTSIDSSINDVTLENVDITGNGEPILFGIGPVLAQSFYVGGVGGLVGSNTGAISLSNVAGAINGTNCVGGLVGVNSGPISSSHTNADVSGVYDVGGLIGVDLGDVVNLHLNGTTMEGYVVIDIAAIYTSASVSSSSSAGSVSGAYNVGGLVGVNFGDKINASYSTSNVLGSVNTGGLVGDNVGNIDEHLYIDLGGGGYFDLDFTASALGALNNSYATGSVSGINATGGLTNGGLTIDSHATGSVSGTNATGGLIGMLEGALFISDTVYSYPYTLTVYFDGNVSGSYATGDVSGTTRVGGLVGYASGGSIADSYVSLLDTATLYGANDVHLITYNDGGVIDTTYGTIWNASYGNITFLDWNVTGTGNLTEFIYLNSNLAHVDSISQPGFDKLANITFHFDSGGLDNWTYRKEINITGSSDGELTDYQVKLNVIRDSGIDSGDTVYLSTNVLENYDDLRFTNADGDLLDYWVESSDSYSAVVWIELDSVAADPNVTTFYIYYGNAGASAASNADTTFQLFDDFSGASLDAEKWTVIRQDSYMQISVSGGILSLWKSQNDRVFDLIAIRSNSNFGPGYAMDALASWSSSSTDCSAGCARLTHGFWNGVNVAGNMHFHTILDNLTVLGVSWWGDERAHFTRSSGTGNSSASTFSDDYTVKTISYLTGETSDFEDYLIGNTFTDSSVPSGNLYASFIGDAGDCWSPEGITSFRLNVDWARVRKYTTNEPSFSAWGSEEAGEYTPTFSDPVVYKDGVYCASGCSAVTPLGGGDYLFNVSGWSNYSIRSIRVEECYAGADVVVETLPFNITDMSTPVFDDLDNPVVGINVTLTGEEPLTNESVGPIIQETNGAGIAAFPNVPLSVLGNWQMTFSVLDGSVNCTDIVLVSLASPFAGGNGTDGNPYQIATWTQLNNTRNYLDAYFILTDNLSDADDDYAGLGDNWTPIGTDSTPFIGSFDGQGYTISGLNISKAGVDYVGLFGYVTGNISNVNLAIASVSGQNNVGGLVGANYGLVDNSSAIIAGSVSGTDVVGGLVGGNNGDGVINSSYATGNVTGTYNVGGLAGGNAGVINSSYATSSVAASAWTVGGLVGSNDGAITSSYSTGNVSGGDNVGGLVGSQSGSITNCSVTIYDSDTLSGNNYVGLILGYNAGTVENTHGTIYDENYGNITFLDWDVIDTGVMVPGNIAVGNNSAYVNATAKPGFNVSANVTLLDTGVTSNAVVYRNGAPCSGLICTGLTQIGADDWMFRADYWSTYTIAENNSCLGVTFSGSGTLVDPYLVTNWTDLNNVRCNLTAYYALTANLSALTPGYTGIGDSWLPIGNCTDDGGGGCLAEFEFTGGFDGRNNTIRNLNINQPSMNHVGLFGSISSSSSIVALGLEDTSVSGYGFVASLVGYNFGTIASSYSTGTVSANNNAGSLVGVNAGTGSITYSHSIGNVLGVSANGGGLVGWNTGTIISSYFTGNVTGGNYIGGLAGGNSGGAAFINASYSEGNVSGSSYFVGGLVGANYEGYITSSYSTSDVSGSDYAVGGFVGGNLAFISYSYSTGNVSGGYSGVGGFVGRNWLSITSSYSTGSVSGSPEIGGFLGLSIGGTISDCGWYDRDNGFNAIGDPAARYITYNETTPSAFYDTAGTHAIYTSWDFINVWDSFCDDEGYPPLKWQNITNVTQCLGYVPPACPDVIQGSGTPVDPYRVCSWTTLDQVRDNLIAYYILTANLSSSDDDYVGLGDSWVPIGGCVDYPFCSNAFTGNFNGNSSSISNLSVSGPPTDAGLFGAISSGAVISNLNLNVVNVAATNSAGGMVGTNIGSTITNCSISVSGTVSGPFAGGSIGLSQGTITNSDVSISGAISGSPYTGGMVGSGAGTIINCSASVSGTLSGSQVGGLAGVTVYITNSTASISGAINSDYAAGGLAGINYGTIQGGSYAVIDDSATLSGTTFVNLLAYNDGGTISSDTYGLVRDSTYGNITFLDWNVTGTGNLTEFIQVGNNTAYVNSVAQPGFNVSANLTLKGTPGLGLSNPAILRDGAVCDETTTPSCYNYTSLLAETVVFNVSGWSNYTIGEEPDTTPPTVELISPPNPTSTSNTTITFIANISDDVGLANASLYTNISGSWELNDTWYSGSLTSDSSTVGLWHFEEGADTTTYDDSGNGNDGTLYNGVAWTADSRFGSYALDFDGSDDYVAVDSSSSLNPSTEVTVSCWVKLDSYSQNINFPAMPWPAACIYKTNDAPGGMYIVEYAMFIENGTGIPNFAVNIADTTGYNAVGPALSLGTWSNLVGTYNASEMNLYVNGVLVNSTPTDGYPISSGSYPLYIGRSVNEHATPDWESYLNASIDEVAVYNRSLSADEVLAQYQVSNAAVNWTLTNIPAGTYIWNVLAYDGSGNPAWAPANYTLEITSSVCPGGMPGSGNSTDPCQINACGLDIDLADKFYTVIGNLSSASGNCVEINATNVTLDCDNMVLTGSRVFGSMGIAVNSDGATVRNCVVTNFSIGINVPASSNSITNNNISSNEVGIWSTNDSSTYANNLLQLNDGPGEGGFGIVLFESQYNNLTNNTFINNLNAGLLLFTSSNNTLINNTFIEDSGYIYTIAAADDTMENTLFNSTDSSILSIPQSTIPGDMVLDPTGLNLSYNKTTIDSIAYPFLNVSSQVTLRGLPFEDAQPLVDYDDDGTYEACSEPQCTGVAYDGVTGTLIFNVSGWTSYAAGEGDITPLSLDWNWSDINSTINVPWTYICVNASENVNCTLHFNNTDYQNISSGTNICWNPSLLIDDYWVRQDDADHSYTEPGMSSFQNAANLQDNDWDTYASWSGTPSGLHFVYKKPLGAESAVWQKKDFGFGTLNNTIPEDCWSYNDTYLHLIVTSFQEPTPPNLTLTCVKWNCIDGSGLTHWGNACRDTGVIEAYEESIFWYMTELPGGNYSNINATCDDTDGNSANTTNAWLYVAECGNGIVEEGEDCDGGTCCEDDCSFNTSADVCRASAGDCDLEETCTGSSASCPADSKSTAVCRAVAGICDIAESCDGVGDDCPADAFNASTDVCRAVAGQCDVAENCTGLDTSCPANSYLPDDTTCNDGRSCTTGDRCVSGHCTPRIDNCGGGDPCDGVDCDDDNVCTDDSCDDGDCVHIDNTASCDDSDECTINDACSGGSCSGAPRTCDDSNACTDDSCNAVTGCIFMADDSNPCDDTNPCTSNDYCSGGVCQSGPNTCACTVASDCTPEICKSVTCTDGQCVYIDLPLGTNCDDLLYCTENDACSSGSCTGTLFSCEDSNTCTDDSCNELTDSCDNTPNDLNACSDGNACTENDTCSAGLCQPGNNTCACISDTDCDDSNVCTSDSCIGNACWHNYAEGSCDDGDSCTSDDYCSSGSCTGQFTCPCRLNADCDDDNSCTAESCTNNTCQYANVAGPCNDANDCTEDDFCAKGLCRPGEIVCPYECGEDWECTNWSECIDGVMARECGCNCYDLGCAGNNTTIQQCSTTGRLTLSITAERELAVGETLHINILDSGGMPVEARLVLIKPDGGLVPIGEARNINYTVELPGVWRIQAFKTGYEDAEAEARVSGPPAALDIAAQVNQAVQSVVEFVEKEPATAALLLCTVFGMVSIFIYWTRRGKGDAIEKF